MAAIERVVELIVLWIARVAQLALVLVTAIIITNIIIRIPWGPLPGTFEMVEALGAVLLGLGVAYCAVKKGHVAVTVLIDKLSPCKQAVVDTFTNIIALFFVSAVGWEMLQNAAHLQARGYQTTQLGLPQYPFYYLVAVGLLSLAVVLLLELIKSIIIVVKEVRS